MRCPVPFVREGITSSFESDVEGRGEGEGCRAARRDVRLRDALQSSSELEVSPLVASSTKNSASLSFDFDFFERAIGNFTLQNLDYGFRCRG
jgi:hypothetical protein